MANFYYQLKEHAKGDWHIWLIFASFVFISVVELFSAGSSFVGGRMHGNYVKFLLGHLKHFGGGILCLLIISSFSSRIFKQKYTWAYAIFVVGSTLLLLMAIMFGPSRDGASRSFGLIQPIEFIKLSIILFVALCISKEQSEKNADKALKPILGVITIPLLLVVTQNLSSALIIAVIVFSLFIIGNVSWKKILSLIGVGSVLALSWLAIGLYAPQSISSMKFISRSRTHVARIERVISTFKNEDIDTSSENEKLIITDENRQTMNSKAAIATGRIWPRMPGSSVQCNYLPQAFSDFIFAIIVEELGLVGGLGVILLYIWLLIRVARIIKKCPFVNLSLILVGLSLLIGIQALVHMIVTCGGPNTGQPLPFISHGGSSLLIMGISLGIIQSIAKTCNEYQEHINTKENSSSEEIKTEE